MKNSKTPHIGGVEHLRRAVGEMMIHDTHSRAREVRSVVFYQDFFLELFFLDRRDHAESKVVHSRAVCIRVITSGGRKAVVPAHLG